MPRNVLEALSLAVSRNRTVSQPVRRILVDERLTWGGNLRAPLPASSSMKEWKRATGG